MKFRTEIEITSLGVKISYENRVLALGSCFAAHIARKLAGAKFRVAENPSGILFNPLSIAAAIRSYADPAPVTRGELGFDGEVWHHFGFHGDFSAPTADEALQKMNAARQAGADALRTADRIVLTFGTAWVYERQGEAVANCHRRPAAEFSKRRLSVEEIVETFAELIEGPLAGKQIILTVSPVRHTGDTLAGNAVSKATLRLAAEQLTEKFKCSAYFPAFEILTDDLRDYRFYADDLTHPSPQAVAYVWERFCEALLTPDARALLPRIAEITAAARHRPLHSASEAYRAFCRRQLEAIERLPGVDFTEETAFFRSRIEINS